MQTAIDAAENGQQSGTVEFAHEMLRSWRFAVLFVVIFGSAALIYVNKAVYYYRAELRVTPAQASQTDGSRLGGLSGLAAVAGISIPQDSGAMSFALYTEGVTSRPVADALARRADLMKVVFDSEWNATAGRFVEPQSSVRSIANAVKGLLGIPVYPWRAPDAARMQDYLQNRISVIQTPKSPVIRIVFDHPDPQFATRFLMALHRVLDASLRQKARIEAEQNIGYLSRQLERVSLAEHRSALAQALSEQEKARMMASASTSFAADPFGPPTASLRPVRPKPATVLALAVIIGIVTAMIFVAARRQIRALRREGSLSARS